MKLAVTSYCYNRHVRTGKMTRVETVEKIKALGVEGIEFSAFEAPEGVDKLDYAAELGAACKAAGLPVVCYAIGADFLAGSGGDLDAEVKRMDGELAIASKLGAALMRHDVASGRTVNFEGVPAFENLLPRIAEGTRRVTERAEALGIRTCTENHGHYMQGVDRVARLCAAVNHPNYGLLADIGNFICADEDGAMALGLIMPLVFHVHLKDNYYRSGSQIHPGRGWGQTRGGNFYKGAVLGYGQTALVPALRILKRAGYEGYMSIEYEGAEDPELGMEISVENVRRFMSMVNAE